MMSSGPHALLNFRESSIPAIYLDSAILISAMSVFVLFSKNVSSV